ncbi:nuclear transport factor 2 family protein [Aquamicrobium sp. LC103]|uniref:nuclear transport factor 2 family protein n=1 Tax=Aquamicrobium sp. LC103 TaxID=1120658 RepID=UPI00069A5D4C|nr:nuclear transport factor 2 family protein [Aquamicrobium sp. LC103]TKT75747.1 nuclear transport factor 2 family protein [Aquamicrobium sp. LC103]
MTSREHLLDAFAMRLTAERYAQAVDAHDAKAFAAQFTRDGVLEAPRGRFEGREQLAGVPPMMKKLYLRTHHSVVALVPIIDGDRASARTYTLARHYYRDAEDVEQCYEMTVRYEDEFARISGEWLIASRRLILVGDATYPTGRRHQVRKDAS